MSKQTTIEKTMEPLTASVKPSLQKDPTQKTSVIGQQRSSERPESVPEEDPIVLSCEAEPIISHDLKRLYYYAGKSYGLKQSRVECADCPKLRETLDELREMMSAMSDNSDQLEIGIDRSTGELEIQKGLIAARDKLLEKGAAERELLLIEVENLKAVIAKQVSSEEISNKSKDFIAEFLNLADRIRSSQDGTNNIVAADEEIAVSSQSSLLPLSDTLEVTQTTVCVSDSQADNEICSPPGTSASISSASINQTTDANSSNTVSSVKRIKVYARSDLKRKFLYKTIKGRSIRSSILNSGAVYSDDVLYMDVPASVSKFNLKFAMECIRNNTSERNRHLFHQYQKDCFWGISHESDGFSNYHFVFYKESSYWCPACAVALNTCPEWKNENVLSHAKLDHFPPEYTNCRLILEIV